MEPVDVPAGGHAEPVVLLGTLLGDRAGECEIGMCLIAVVDRRVVDADLEVCDGLAGEWLFRKHEAVERPIDLLAVVLTVMLDVIDGSGERAQATGCLSIPRAVLVGAWWLDAFALKGRMLNAAFRDVLVAGEDAIPDITLRRRVSVHERHALTCSGH